MGFQSPPPPRVTFGKTLSVPPVVDLYGQLPLSEDLCRRRCGTEGGGWKCMAGGGGVGMHGMQMGGRGTPSFPVTPSPQIITAQGPNCTQVQMRATSCRIRTYGPQTCTGARLMERGGLLISREGSSHIDVAGWWSAMKLERHGGIRPDGLASESGIGPGMVSDIPRTKPHPREARGIRCKKVWKGCKKNLLISFCK